MKKVRDTQRLKLYRAEREIAAYKEPTMDSIKAVEKYVDRIITSEFWRKNIDARSLEVLVGDGRGRRIACARGTREIVMPKWSRMRLVILHELTHIAIAKLHPRGDYAWHGREFAALYLRIVRRFIGADTHNELKAAFIKNKVRFKPKRVIAPAALARMRERGREMAAARKAKE